MSALEQHMVYTNLTDTGNRAFTWRVTGGDVDLIRYLYAGVLSQQE